MQPKWFTLLALLHHKKSVSVVGVAQYLDLSQPAVSQFCKQLSDNERVHIVTCSVDSRRKVLTISVSGQAQVDKMLPMWQTVQRAAAQTFTEFENDFYQSLRKCERALQKKSPQQRTLEAYNDPRQ